jgi:fibronectin-binding autotransporter adhesin
LAILASGVVNRAYAQPSLWNGYQGGSSVDLSFVPSNLTKGGPLPLLGVNLSTGTPSSSINLIQNPSFTWTVDTGSTGMVISTDNLAKYGINAKLLHNLGPGSITYTSSNETYSGFYSTLNVGLYSTSSNGTGTLAATAQVPVLIATSYPYSIQQFGVGFGRGTTGATYDNPLLNLTSVSTGNLQSMAPGYVVSRSGIELGLTPAQLQNTAFSGLLPSASTISTTLTNAYAIAATKSDWQTPALTMTIANASASSNGTAYGSILVDTGIANIELSTGATAYWNPHYDPSNPAQSSSIQVYLPGATSATGQPLTYQLLYQGTCPGDTGSCPSPTGYNASSYGLSPVYPANSSNAPGNGIAFVGASAAQPIPAPFMNTGVEFLNYFNVIYDPVSGFIGYQESPTASLTSNNPSVTQSIALQGTTPIPGGTDISVPTFLFAEFADGYSGTAGPQTVVQLSSPGQVTISGVISSALICGSVSCSATGLEIAGGAFVLTANNAYLGGTTIDPGAILALSGAGSIAASSGVAANGTFDISGTAAGASIATLVGSGTVDLGSRPLTLTNASSVFAGTIADGGIAGGAGGSLTIAGGTQTLSGVNTYTGGTTIAGGAVLALGGAGSIAASSGVAANGTFDISGTAAGASIATLVGSGTVNLGSQPLTLSNASSVFAGTIADGGIAGGASGSLTIAGGTQTLTGVNTYTGGTTIAGGAVLALAGAGSIAASSGVAANGTFDISGTGAGASIATLGGSGTVNLGSQPLTLTNASGMFAGTIADGGIAGGAGGSLVIAGGTQTLTGVNTYTGGTTITGGATLAINADAALGAATAPLVFNSGTLLALADLVGTRPIIVESGGGTVDAAGFSVALGGSLTVNGPLVTLGNVMLGGNANIATAFTVSTGTLSVNGDLQALSLTVADGATLRGTGTIHTPTRVAGRLAAGNSPGTLHFTAPVTLLPTAVTQFDIDGTGTGTGAGNYSRVLVRGAGNTYTAAGTLVPLLRGITGSATNTYTPPLGQVFQVVTAEGGVRGGYAGLIQPAGLAAGTRIDALYGATTIAMVVTPRAYGALAAAGLAESANQSAVGDALDATRPAAGVPMTSTQAALYAPLYELQGAAIGPTLDTLSPVIDADAPMIWRGGWYLLSGAVDAALEARRGGQPDPNQQIAVGPQGSTIWVNALGQFDSVGSANGVPGYSGSSGGVAAGIDMPVLPNVTAGAALAFVSPQFSSTNGQDFWGQGLEATVYASLRQGIWFVDAQAGALFFQDNTTRSLPQYGAQASGQTGGAGGGGSVRAGAQVQAEAWQIEPSASLRGMGLSRRGFAETQAGAADLSLDSEGLTSVQSVLALQAERRFPLGETPFGNGLVLVPTARAGWAHEFADTRGTASASFTGLASAFGMRSAPVGRDAALVGVGATLLTTGSVSFNLAYSGAFAENSNAQTVTGTVSVKW